MTKHSIIRTEERASVKERVAKRLINNAKERGLAPNCFPLRERKYLESRENEKRIVRYYLGYCFVFSSDFCCITMFPVPQWFGKKVLFQGKTKIRKPKKYARNNPDYFDIDEKYNIA